MDNIQVTLREHPHAVIHFQPIKRVDWVHWVDTIKGSQDLTSFKSTPTTWTNGLKKKKIPSNKSLTGNNTQVQAKDKIMAEPIPSPPTRSSVPLGGKYNDALIRSDNKSSIK